MLHVTARCSVNCLSFDELRYFRLLDAASGALSGEKSIALSLSTALGGCVNIADNVISCSASGFQEDYSSWIFDSLVDFCGQVWLCISMTSTEMAASVTNGPVYDPSQAGDNYSQGAPALKRKRSDNYFLGLQNICSSFSLSSESNAFTWLLVTLAVVSVANLLSALWVIHVLQLNSVSRWLNISLLIASKGADWGVTKKSETITMIKAYQLFIISFTVGYGQRRCEFCIWWTCYQKRCKCTGSIDLSIDSFGQQRSTLDNGCGSEFISFTERVAGKQFPLSWWVWNLHRTLRPHDCDKADVKRLNHQQWRKSERERVEESETSSISLADGCPCAWWWHTTSS